MLPEMTVEKRSPEHAHGVKPPTEPGTPEFMEQLSDTLTLLDDCKTNRWNQRLLQKYCPWNLPPAASTMREFDFRGWQDVCRFVIDDECPELFIRFCKWAKVRQLEIKEDKGFIDGTGLGVMNTYMDLLKPAMEKGGDVKWFYKAIRPLQYLHDQGQLSSLHMFNGTVHPGHWRYCAWHATKFYAAYVAMDKLYHLSELNKTTLLSAAYIAAMGRTGINVHLPEDNVASGVLFGLEEFKEYEVQKGGPTSLSEKAE